MVGDGEDGGERDVGMRQKGKKEFCVEGRLLHAWLISQSAGRSIAVRALQARVGTVALAVRLLGSAQWAQGLEATSLGSQWCENRGGGVGGDRGSNEAARK